MRITKTLFCEFATSPKLARFHANDKEIYKLIQEAEYGDMDGAKIGQTVEDQVKELFDKNDICAPQGDFFGAITDSSRLCSKNAKVIYQPWFQSYNLLVRSDFLVLNEQGTYDLWEVKAKNTVRKTTKGEPLKEELINDISFQRYVISKALGAKFSGKCFLVYLNKDYVRQGELDLKQLIKIEDVTGELLDDQAIENIVSLMGTQLGLERRAFEALYPYNNEDHLVYFGLPAPQESIRAIPGIGNKKKDLYERGKTNILTLGEEEKQLLLTTKGEATKSSNYVEMYQRAETLIDMERIRSQLSALEYPLFFYDYETISNPIPLLEGTAPRQHVIVQYSVHKIDLDGRITHKEYLIGDKIQDNKKVIDQLYEDLEHGNGTYIVWYKGFENTRNLETAKMYPEYQEFFEKVNEHTFDLMEIFSEYYYFDRRFKGSSSIKKVLPVLTDISYDGLEVSNGVIATGILMDIAMGNISPEQLEKHRQNLLEYCKQDTWAMVRIWQELVKKIGVLE
jgi:hypothetical protein